MADWSAIRAAYEAGTPNRENARLNGPISETAIRKKATAEGWVRGSSQGANSSQGPNPPEPPKPKPMEGELQPPQNRLETGRFAPGNKANPGGRPKELYPEVVELARGNTKTCIKGLMDIGGNSRYPAAARVQAYIAVLDRGWGKAPQLLAVSNQNDDKPRRDRPAMEAKLAGILEGIVNARKHDEARATAQEAEPVGSH